VWCAARPQVDRSEIILVDQFRQRAAPVVTQVDSFRPRSADHFRQMRRQIVTAAVAKFGEEVRGPVGFVHFEAVAEDGIRRMVAKGTHQWLGHILQVILNRLGAEMVNDKTLGPICRALHFADRCGWK